MLVDIEEKENFHISHPFTLSAIQRLGLHPPRMRGIVNGESDVMQNWRRGSP